MLLESVFINEIYYVIMFILWKIGVWEPTLSGIALMFCIGMTIDLISTFGCYLHLLKKEKIEVNFKFNDLEFNLNLINIKK
ncbi:hypothetical protein [Metamycoplasma equirhinis]|uniref:hypothetical protein n=1 Tax=Metamycoplasma equirhinis TaxID=92402 RepID=UPI0025737568|nr:hypothetical protein [Metamycoplasma equirhinis]